MTVGDRIKYTREKLELSQTELAKRMGYTGKASVSKIECSGNDVTMKTIARYAEALGVTQAYLLGWEKDEDIERTADILAKITKDEDWLECSSLYYSYSEEKKRLIRNTIINLKDC